MLPEGAVLGGQVFGRLLGGRAGVLQPVGLADELVAAGAVLMLHGVLQGVLQAVELVSLLGQFLLGMAQLPGQPVQLLAGIVITLLEVAPQIGLGSGQLL